MKKLLAVATVVAGLAFAATAQAAPSCLNAPGYAAFTSYNPALFISRYYGSGGHSHTLGQWDYGTCYLEPSNGRTWVHWEWPETDNQTGVQRWIVMGAYVYGSAGAYNMGAVSWSRQGPGFYVLQSGSYQTPAY